MDVQATTLPSSLFFTSVFVRERYLRNPVRAIHAFFSFWRTLSYLWGNFFLSGATFFFCWCDFFLGKYFIYPYAYLELLVTSFILYSLCIPLYIWSYILLHFPIYSCVFPCILLYSLVFSCIPLRETWELCQWSKLDCSDHDASKEPMNLWPEWTHQFLWCTLIWVIYRITGPDPDHTKGMHP